MVRRLETIHRIVCLFDVLGIPPDHLGQESSSKKTKQTNPIKKKPKTKVDIENIKNMLSLRKGLAEISTPRREEDEFEILSGVFEGKTTGTPILLLAENESVIKEKNSIMVTKNLFIFIKIYYSSTSSFLPSSLKKSPFFVNVSSTFLGLFNLMRKP